MDLCNMDENQVPPAHDPDKVVENINEPSTVEKNQEFINTNIGKIVYQFIKRYVNYLLTHQIYEDKDSLKSHIGKLVSSAMDNGDCSITTMDRLMQYIDESAILNKERKAMQNYENMVTEVVSEALLYATTVNTNSTLAAQVRTYQQVAMQCENLKKSLIEVFWSKTEPAIKTFIAKYSKYIDTQFLNKFKSA